MCGVSCMSSISIETERQVLGNGDAFIKLSLPKLTENLGTLNKNFAAYYGKMHSGFTDYANNKLAKAAAKRQGAPYGAALNTVMCHENENIISLYTDLNVSDGTGNRYSRHGVLWHKPTGNIINPKTLFEKGAKKAVLQTLCRAAEEKSQSSSVPLFSDVRRRIKGNFRWAQFYISPAAAIFYYSGGLLNADPKPFPLSFGEKELFTSEARLMLWGLE